MGVAARVAQLHDTMQRAKEQYINLRNQYYGTNETVEDVFEKEEKRKQKEAKSKRATPSLDVFVP